MLRLNAYNSLSLSLHHHNLEVGDSYVWYRMDGQSLQELKTDELQWSLGTIYERVFRFQEKTFYRRIKAVQELT